MRPSIDNFSDKVLTTLRVEVESGIAIKAPRERTKNGLWEKLRIAQQGCRKTEENVHRRD